MSVHEVHYLTNRGNVVNLDESHRLPRGEYCTHVCRVGDDQWTRLTGTARVPARAQSEPEPPQAPPDAPDGESGHPAPATQ